MNEANLARRRTLDALLTGLMALLLLMSGGWGVLAIGVVRKSREMFAELDAALPTMTRWAISMVGVPVAPAAMLVLLLGGFASLFLVRDRTPALLGALAAAIAIGFLGLLLVVAIIVPIVTIIQTMSNQ